MSNSTWVKEVSVLFGGDVRDSSVVKELVKGVDAVFHLAALVSVSESFEDPVLTNDVNVGGTLNLLRVCGF